MGESGWNPSQDKARSSDLPSQSEESSKDEVLNIVVVEDNAADAYLIREAIKASGVRLGIHTLRDGEKATQFFDAIDQDDTLPRPGLIILDINLPKKQGGEVLAHMRQSRRSRDARVIVVSTSNSDRDRQSVTKFGVDAYFQKASEFDEFLKLGDLIRGLLS